MCVHTHCIKYKIVAIHNCNGAQLVRCDGIRSDVEQSEKLRAQNLAMLQFVGLNYFEWLSSSGLIKCRRPTICHTHCGRDYIMESVFFTKKESTGIFVGGYWHLCRWREDRYIELLAKWVRMCA